MNGFNNSGRKLYVWTISGVPVPKTSSTVNKSSDDDHVWSQTMVDGTRNSNLGKIKEFVKRIASVWRLDQHCWQ